MCSTNHQKYLFPSCWLPSGPFCLKGQVVQNNRDWFAAFTFLWKAPVLQQCTPYGGVPQEMFAMLPVPLPSLTPLQIPRKQNQTRDRISSQQLIGVRCVFLFSTHMVGFWVCRILVACPSGAVCAKETVQLGNWCVFPSLMCQPSSAEVGFLYLLGSKQSGRCTCAPEVAAGHHLVRKQCQGDRSKHRCS